MTGPDPISIGLRFLLLLALQVVLFRQVGFGFGGAEYLSVLVSPLFIALLPLRTPRPLVVLLGFVIGFGTDLFYESLGVHMAAATFAAYVRRFILAALAPKDGYKIKANPDGQSLGFTWWMQYVALVLVAYLVWYFSMEAFSPVFWRTIALKSIVSIAVSWLVCMVFVTLFRPRI